MNTKVGITMEEVLLLIGAGQIGMAIARRVGIGKKILIGDKNISNAHSISKTLNEAGFDTSTYPVDLADKNAIIEFIQEGLTYGEITSLINAAGVSPSQASIETILQVDLYGTAVLLEEVGKVITLGGSGITISSQSGYRMPALSEKDDKALATTPVDELLSLEILQPSNIMDSLHAYQLAKRANAKRVMSEAVKWGKKGARINAISPGIVVTPLALDDVQAAYEAMDERKAIKSLLKVSN